MDTTPDGLWREIQDAVSLRKDYLDVYRGRLNKWVGNRYRREWRTKPQLENYAHSYIAFMLPQLVFDRPVVAVSPLADPRDTATAEAMEAKTNQWILCAKYKQVLKGCARDLLLGWGVTYKGIDLAQPGTEKVFCRSIPMGDYFCDANCYGYSVRRFEGHAFDKTRDELLADPMYADAAEIIQGLQTSTEQRQREDLPVDKPQRTARQEVITLYQIFLRETREIVTLAQAGGTGTAMGSGPVILRRAPFDGPEQGPYTLWGVYEVPGQVYPLPPLAATEEQQDDLNDHANAASKSARTYKKFVAFRKGDDEDGKTAQTVKNGQVAGFSSPESMKDVELGGMSDAQSAILELLRERLDRNLGFSDAQRGMANSETATANQLAQNNSDLRTDYIRGCLTDCAEEDLRAVAWYFFNREEVVQDLILENKGSGQAEPVAFLGGKPDPAMVEDLIAQGMVDPAARHGIDREWTDYHLKINIESMVKVADPIRQKRAQDELQMAFGFAQVLAAAFGPAAPLQGINWRRLFRRYGQAFNEPQYDVIFLTDQFGLMVAPDPLNGGMPMGAMMPGSPMMQQPGMGGPPQPGQGGGGPPAGPQVGGGGAPPQPPGLGFAPGVPRSPVSRPGMMANAGAGY
jgi:hypothetical protein